MALGVETSLHVEVLNTLVTMVATALILFLAPGLQKWLSRRHWNSVSQGKASDLLVSEGFDGVREFAWKVRQSSSGGSERWQVVRDLLPYVLVIAGLNLLPFSTSGVGANASEKDGIPVEVIGSLANPTGAKVETLNLDTLLALQRGDIDGEAAPFLLGSPELFNYGTDVVGLDWSVYFSGTSAAYTESETEDGVTDLMIFGSQFDVEQDGAGKGTYPVTTCLTVTEEGGVYSAGTCGDVRVELEANEYVVESVDRVYWTSESCYASVDAVFNQGVTYRWRTLTLDLNQTHTFTEEALVVGTEVSAVCGEIYESIIEACIFDVGGHLYVGDWNIGSFEDSSCEPDDESNDDYTPRSWNMTVVEIDGSSGTLPSSEEYQVAVAMLAEVVVGSGTITSRQQLALVLGVFSRMAAMKLGVGVAYHPETVVVVTISRVVLALWAFLLTAGCVIHIRERRLDCKVFIPTSAWDWYAVGARESLGAGSASLSKPPSAHHYLTKYGCPKTVVDGDDGVQRLSWVSPGMEEADGIGRGDALHIPPTRVPEFDPTGVNVDASRSTPRPVDGPLRRSMQF